MALAREHRPGKAKKCWCGSGRKAKNCHGLESTARVLPRLGAPTPGNPTESIRIPAPTVQTSHPGVAPWGIPGEEHSLAVVPRFQGQPIIPPSDEVKGRPGKYKVQVLLSRPGYPLSTEREHAFIDEFVGDSHISIAKPRTERGPADVESILLQAAGHGRQVVFRGLPNDRGFLGKLVVDELCALSIADAEKCAYESLAPFLSGWALHLDIPVHVETIQVTDLQTQVSSLRVRTPHFEMTFAGGQSPPLTDDFCRHASLYREGMNSNSAFYRFLCFYKVIESIVLRRTRLNEEAKAAGREPIRRAREIIPGARDELLGWLGEVYPWRSSWDDFALDQLIPPEAAGKKLGWLREKHLNPLRVRIAHALLDTGEAGVRLDSMEHIQEINKWLPLCRTIARSVIRNEFPEEFALMMKPLAFAAVRKT